MQSIQPLGNSNSYILLSSQRWGNSIVRYGYLIPALAPPRCVNKNVTERLSCLR
jgi:hypothetical protein